MLSGHRDLKRVLVFIASPSDVAGSRDAARKAVERINRLVANRNGFLLESIGWEILTPGISERTQELINPYVDNAHIFIGILHKRFGAPTGVADSGFKEEFDRIIERWRKETNKPEILLFFKKMEQTLLEDPGPQLQRVVNFKNQIKHEVFYKEYEYESDFKEMVENALADWIYKNSPMEVREVPVSIPSSIESSDIRCLLLLAKTPMAFNGLRASLALTDAAMKKSIGRLTSQNMIVLPDGSNTSYRISESSEAFVTIASYLLTEDYSKSFLSSNYYSRMLNNHLEAILLSRQHCRCEPQMHAALCQLLKISPKAASVVLFGDTTRYDNLHNQIQKQGSGSEVISTANDFTVQNLLYECLVCAANDLRESKLADEIDGSPIALVLSSIRIAAASENNGIFDLSILYPISRVKAGSEFLAGQMAFGGPEFHMRLGLLFMHVAEYELALKAFNMALSRQIAEKLKAAILNNKALCLERTSHVEDAKACLVEALKLDPELMQAKENYLRLERP